MKNNLKMCMRKMFWLQKIVYSLLKPVPDFNGHGHGLVLLCLVISQTCFENTTGYVRYNFEMFNEIDRIVPERCIYQSNSSCILFTIGRLLFSEKISRVDALIRWWTLINFLAKFQGGRLFQCGRLLIFAKLCVIFRHIYCIHPHPSLSFKQ